ncbi:MAG: hypothetical protein FAZ92_02928 [Accumulibacter sp.]|nr:MAG: hypothetical protein FAZ92_02928 [Accumulibacter sp.]
MKALANLRRPPGGGDAPPLRVAPDLDEVAVAIAVDIGSVERLSRVCTAERTRAGVVETGAVAAPDGGLQIAPVVLPEAQEIVAAVAAGVDDEEGNVLLPDADSLPGNRPGTIVAGLPGAQPGALVGGVGTGPGVASHAREIAAAVAVQVERQSGCRQQVLAVLAGLAARREAPPVSLPERQRAVALVRLPGQQEVSEAIAGGIEQAMVAARWVSAEFAARRVRQAVADRQPGVGDHAAVGGLADQRQIAATVAVEVAAQVARCRPPGSQFDRVTLGKGAARCQPLTGDRLAVCAMADLQQVAPAVAVEVGVEPREIALPALLGGEIPAVRQPQLDLHLPVGTACAGEQVGAAIAVVIAQSPVGLAAGAAEVRLGEWAVPGALGGGHGAPGSGHGLAASVPPELDDVAAQVAVHVAGEELLRRPRGAERARARRRETAAIVPPECHLQFTLVVVRDVEEVAATAASAAGEQRDVPRPRPERVAGDAAAAAVADAQPGARVAAVRVLRRIALHDDEVAAPVAVGVDRQPLCVGQALPGGILGDPSLEGAAVSSPDTEPVAAVSEDLVHAEVGEAIAIAVAEAVVGVGGVGGQLGLASMLQAVVARQPGVDGGQAAACLADLAEVAAAIAVDVADQVAVAGQPGAEDDRFTTGKAAAAGEPRSGDGHAVAAWADLQQVAAAIGVDIGFEQDVCDIGAGRCRGTARAGRWGGDDDAGGCRPRFAAVRPLGRHRGGSQGIGGDWQVARKQQPRFERLAMQAGLECCGRGAPIRGDRPAAGGRRRHAAAPGSADGSEQGPQWRPLHV